MGRQGEGGERLVNHVAGPEDSGRHSSASRYRRGVAVLGCNFFGVFGGFQAAQGLQTSLNATLGFVNLSCLYGTFTLCSLVAAPVSVWLESLVGLRGALLAASLTYVAMIFSNISVVHWALPITMNVLVGVGAPLLWACQNDYVGRCAFQAALGGRVVQSQSGLTADCGAGAGAGAGAVAGGGGGAPNPSTAALAVKTAQFNGLFFSIYQFAGMAGNVLASSLMLLFAKSPGMKQLLFCVLGGVSSLGALSFLCLPSVGSAGASAAEVSLRDTVTLPLSDPRMSLLVPLILTNGMTISYVVGDFPSSVVSPVAGPGFVGFVAATFFGVNALACALWARLIARGLVSRRLAYLVSCLLVAAFLVAVMLWDFPRSYEKEVSSGEWRQRSSPRPLDVAWLFLLVGLFAAGDSFLESGPISTLQNYFLNTRQAVPAMVNAKLWQSVGYAAQFALGAAGVGSPALRALVLAGLCALSAVCVCMLDCRAPLL